MGYGPVVRVVQTCAGGPCQWDAWTSSGTQLYLRYRHGRGRVELGNGRHLNPKILDHFADNGGSVISLENFMANVDLTLADDAEVVPYDDPMEEDPAGEKLPAGLAPVPPAGLLKQGAAGSPPQPAAPAPPTPFLQGSFALYVTPAGGAVLAYRAKGSSEDKQLAIPPVVLQMAGQASGLSPADILARIQSGNLDV